MVYSIVFLILAAICNACMDNLAHHYYKSIFKKSYNKENTKWNNFWNPDLAWRFSTYIPYTKYPISAWHLFKSIMIIFIILGLISAWVDTPPFLDIWWFYILFILFLGVLWNCIFNLFYNYILIKK